MLHLQVDAYGGDHLNPNKICSPFSHRNGNEARSMASPAGPPCPVLLEVTCGLDTKECEQKQCVPDPGLGLNPFSEFSQ